MKKNLLELFNQYKLSPKTFANKYKNAVRHRAKNPTCHEFVDNVDSMLNPYYNKYGYQNFSEIFYVIGYGESNGSCKFCNNTPVLFLNFNRGYSKYCSSACSSKDCTRVSDEKRKIGILKRKEKMKALLNDPIAGDIYRKKIGIKSKYYMSNPKEKARRSMILKQKILSGEFTPNITNSWTHRESKIDGIPFRSSFEALFYIFNKLYKKKDIRFEELRIKYFFESKDKIYIIDFIDHENKNVFEIKPASLTENEKNKAKRKAILEWCASNSYEYYEITEVILKVYIRELIETGYQHEFLDEFRRKYSKWL